jgi:hypothetical protein
VYNTSAHDSLESLRWMDGVVDTRAPLACTASTNGIRTRRCERGSVPDGYGSIFPNRRHWRAMFPSGGGAGTATQIQPA